LFPCPKFSPARTALISRYNLDVVVKKIQQWRRQK
jgi:hypothetical protein